MDIASRIENINNNLENAYNSIESLGIDIGEKNKNLENLSTIFDEIYDNQEKINDEGINITLNNTKKSGLRTILKGDMNQKNIPGNQLYNKNDIYGYTSAVTFLEDDWISFDFTNNTSSIKFQNIFSSFNSLLSPSTTYSLIVEVKDLETTGELTNSSYFSISSSSETTLTQFNESKRFDLLNAQNFYKFSATTVNDFTDRTICLRSFLGVGSGVSVKMKVRISILEDTTITQDNFVYEPFVGGKISPNPDYPQEIKVVTGNKNIKIQNKNLNNGINQNIYLNIAVNQCGRATDNSGIFIPINGGYYTISTTTTQERYRVACTNEVPTYVVQTAYQGQNKDNTSDSITIDTTGYNYLIVNATDLSAIQIEQSQSSSNYASYQEQNYSLSLGSLELAKIGNYQDYLIRNNRKNLFNNTFNHIAMWSTTEGSTTSFAEGNQYLGAYCKVQPGKTYSISRNKITNRFAIAISNEVPTTSSSALVIKKDYSAYKIENITIPDNYSYIILYLSNSSENSTGLNIMINEGSTSLPYEPYGKGNWYKYNNIKKIIFDGSENWLINTAFTSEYMISKSEINLTLAQNSTQFLSNYFLAYIGTAPASIGKIRIGSSYLCINYDNGNGGINNFKTWLSTHNLIMYYILTEPEITEITDTNLIEQLNNLYKAKAYDEQTHIFQENNILPFIINASALKKDSD